MATAIAAVTTAVSTMTTTVVNRITGRADTATMTNGTASARWASRIDRIAVSRSNRIAVTNWAAWAATARVARTDDTSNRSVILNHVCSNDNGMTVDTHVHVLAYVADVARILYRLIITATTRAVGSRST